MPSVSMTFNGKPVSAGVEGRTPLVQFLRECLGLAGTHGVKVMARRAVAAAQ
jgi:aerobic-type carbon monoxide dehydrogenase small subunit (CoxS/CutS family)